MPTYDASAFSHREHSWDEIAQAACQSELVHETNIALSFLPVLASKWFGACYVFLQEAVASGVSFSPFASFAKERKPARHRRAGAAPGK